ncbi:hypothetical protein [Ekhidna sp.]
MQPLRRPQKEKEWMLFQRLNELLNLRASNISQPKPPQPDILATINNKHVGIEISELYSDNREQSKGSRLARNQSIREKVLELAIRRVEQTIDFHFELHVSFDRNEILDSEIQPLSIEIAKIIISKLSNVTSTDEWIIIKHDNLNYNINLSRIYIYVSNKLSRHYYSPVAAGQVPHLSEQNIKTAIANKEPKISKYSEHCDEVWLLLVELGGIASAFDNVTEATRTMYQSEFNRICLLRSFYDEVLEIKTCD